MKLYYAPGTCSLAVRIAALESGLELSYERVSTRTKKTETDADYLQINPRGYVPAMRLDDDSVLTEVAVLLQYVADKSGSKTLLPAQGDPQRYRALEWLSFIATEIHKTLSTLFNTKAPDEFKALTREALGAKLTALAPVLDGREGLMGSFSAPDAYLFTVLRWTQFVGVDRAQWPAVQAWYERTAERDSVKSALSAEGIKR